MQSQPTLNPNLKLTHKEKQLENYKSENRQKQY